MTRLGVIGAGTMGGGIAQVAAQQGIDVVLLDAAPELVQGGIERIGGALNRAVERQRLSRAEADTTLSKIRPARNYAELGEVDWVIEAVVEDLAVKRAIFQELDQHCRDSAILASNTSSLSITEIASSTKHPERVVGLHFFNPVPAMALVEIIRGSVTAVETVTAAVELARQLGKTPVRVVDGPGFLVNRVARPFYTEALRIYGDGLADFRDIDAVMRGLGFRMGPFQLMDLIGNDVNLAVTTSIYEQLYHEPRFRPSFAQKRLVSSGNLGQKTGQGWYSYGDTDDDESTPADVKGESGSLGPVEIMVDGRYGLGLAEALQAAGVEVNVRDMAAAGRDRAVAPQSPSAGLIVDATTTGLAIDNSHRTSVGVPVLAVTLTRGTTEAASGWSDPTWVCGIGPLPPFDAGAVLEIAPGLRTSEAAVTAARGLAKALGKEPVMVGDGCGLVGARILSVLINEAAWAITEGIAEGADIDTAVRLGVNYPRGLLEWGDLIGLDLVYQMVEGLQREAHDDRYRPAPALRKLVFAGWHGQATGRGFFVY